MSAEERQAEPPSNDNSSAFEHFMHGYWNQMASDFYSVFGEALADFKETEGKQRFALLRKNILALAASGQFPSLAEIESAYDDPFWSDFDRILTIEDLRSCDDFNAELALLKR